MKPTMRLQLCLLLFALVNLAAAYPDYCYNRNDEVVDEKKCIYGWDVDPCGIKVCAKGPGEVCGGKHQRYGICGEGLMCSNCNRCQGCSMKTFECFDDRQCIWSVP